MDKFKNEIISMDLLDALRKISNVLTEAFNNGNLTYVNEILISFNDVTVNNSILKTILIETKSFRDNDIIKDSRKNILELLEIKRGEKLV